MNSKEDERGGNQQQRVENDLSVGGILSGNYRQHGNVSAGIVLLEQERQCPEVRWCPQKDDNKHPQRGKSVFCNDQVFVQVIVLTTPNPIMGIPCRGVRRESA